MARITKNQIDQIIANLTRKFVKDSDFAEAEGLQDGDFFTLVQDGENKRYPLASLKSDFLADMVVKGAYNSTEYWNEHDYIPEAGEIIIYSDYKSYEDEGETVLVPGIKLGSGNAYLSDLAFLGEADTLALMNHIANSDIHVTRAQKVYWDGKLNIDDEHEVVNETLIFNRD